MSIKIPPIKYNKRRTTYAGTKALPKGLDTLERKGVGVCGGASTSEPWSSLAGRNFFVL